MEAKLSVRIDPNQFVEWMKQELKLSEGVTWHNLRRVRYSNQNMETILVEFEEVSD